MTHFEQALNKAGVVYKVTNEKVCNASIANINASFEINTYSAMEDNETIKEWTIGMRTFGTFHFNADEIEKLISAIGIIAGNPDCCYICEMCDLKISGGDKPGYVKIHRANVDSSPSHILFNISLGTANADTLIDALKQVKDKL